MPMERPMNDEEISKIFNKIKEVYQKEIELKELANVIDNMTEIREEVAERKDQICKSEKNVEFGEEAKEAATKQNEALSKFKSPSEFDFHWNCIMRAEEEAMSKTRPWQKLELIPAYDPKKLLNSEKGECLHKDYVFGKNIDINEFENAIKSLDGLDFDIIQSRNVLKSKSISTYKRIKIFYYPFDPMPLAKRIDIDTIIWSEAFAQAQLYLLGTAHRTRQSILDVQNLMRAIQPDIIFVELCKTRAVDFQGLLTDEEIDKKLKRLDEVWQKKLNDFGWLKRWLLNNQEKKRRDYLRKSRDGEFRAAMEMATKLDGCAGLVLGDKPYALETREILNLRHISGMKDFEKEYNDIVLGERDRYMTKVLHTMMHRCTLEKLCASQRNGVKFEPVTIVGIVGLAHLEGIERLWSNQEELYSEK